MDVGPGVAIDDHALGSFARRHGITRLSVFGSVLGDTFGPDSDVDVLVKFAPGSVPGLLGMAAMEIELSELIGREVDLRTAGDLSTYFRDDVEARARTVYAA